MDRDKFIFESKQFTKEIDNCIAKVFENIDNKICIPMTYSVLPGGKRIRPLLMIATARAINLDYKKVLPYCVAIELIHGYSLIHDDLPAMDNDDIRRGKSTNHKVFGEGLAILAGDGLLNLAYEHLHSNLLINNLVEDILATQCLSTYAGSNGMILGQVLDIENEDKSITINELKEINLLKTGVLIKGSLEIPAILKNVDKKKMEVIKNIGHNLGLLYQLKDDLLDIYGKTKYTGKSMGSDIKNNKRTYLSILGKKETLKIYETLKKETEKLVDSLTCDEYFKNLIKYIIDREK